MSTTPAGQGIRGFLESHPDFDRAELDLTAEDRTKRLAAVDATKLTAWIAALDDSDRSGVQQAWMVGRVLVAQRALVPKGKGNVARWEKALASVLKKLPRTLQLYRQLAEGLEDTKIAMALRESHLDDGLNVVIGRIRNVRNGREPDYKAQKANEDRQAELAVAALDKAVKRACKHLGTTWVESWSNDRLPGLVAEEASNRQAHVPAAADGATDRLPAAPARRARSDRPRRVSKATLATASNKMSHVANGAKPTTYVEDLFAVANAPNLPSAAPAADQDSVA